MLSSWATALISVLDGPPRDRCRTQSRQRHVRLADGDQHHGISAHLLGALAQLGADLLAAKLLQAIAMRPHVDAHRADQRVRAGRHVVAGDKHTVAE